MRLRMRVHISGLLNGEHWPPAGGILDLDHEGEARGLIRNGLAVEVPAPVIETAEVAPPRNAAKRTSKPQPKARRSSRPAKEEG